jgi:DNA polymerase, archaea type
MASPDVFASPSVAESIADADAGVALVQANTARNLVMRQGYPPRLVVDETRLDLQSPSALPDVVPWQPTRAVMPYEQVPKLYLDIETLGLDAKGSNPNGSNPNEINTSDADISANEAGRIIAIGLRDERGITYKLSHPDEGWLLRQALAAIAKKQPKILLGYNHLAFDLPFIIERCRQHGIAHPFRVSDQERRVGASRLHGRSIRYHPIYAKGIDIIDVYHLVLINDFGTRQLTRYSLKVAALEFGLREQPRLELSHQEISHLWAQGNIEPILKYLDYDLEDTELVANYLVPSIYYQQEFVPGMSVQALATNGNGTKWQKMMEAQYPNRPVPEADLPVEFEGSLNEGFAGLYRNVSKVDVSSLYPSLMLRYGICSHKDPEGKMLGVLANRLSERLALKALGKQGDRMAQQKQGASKIMINSAYGFLGTGGVGYNDFEAAALVTAYGRAIARLMVTTIEQAGGVIAEVDTDGVLFSAPLGENERIFCAVQAALPDGIVVEHEFQAEAAFIPALGDGVTGQRKNYLVFFADGRVKATGRFRSRDRNYLERNYQADYIKAFLQSLATAEAFHQQTLAQLRSGSYPIEHLITTRKIRRGEKALLVLGREGDLVTFYEGTNGAKINQGSYDSRYYCQLIELMRAEVLQVAAPEQFLAGKPRQLDLF